MGDPEPGSGVQEPSFDALLAEAGAAETSRSAPRPHAVAWLLIASLAAILVGIGGVVVTLLVASSGAAAERIAAAQAASAPVQPPALREIAEPAAEPAAEEDEDDAGQVAIDADWAMRVAERTRIPERALVAYATASARMTLERPGCGIGWNTLAGIGFVESEHGTLQGGAIVNNGRVVPPIVGIPLDGTSTDRIPDTDGGMLDGDRVWDRAVGPMQFIPSTWANWGLDANGDSIADPQNIDDAAYSAAVYLCSNGGSLREPGGWIAAIAAYNDTIEYNHRVASAAEHYAGLAAGL